MASPFQKFLLSVVFSFLFLANITSSTNIGVTYDPSYPNLPPPERVAGKLHSMGVKIVRILHPSPPAVQAFSHSHITLLLSVPNSFISSFAAKRSAASLWLYNNVLPFYPRSRISMISVGDDVISSPSGSFISDPSTMLIPAMRHLRLALGELGIKSISVSTTFSFENIMNMSFPPSTADFQRPSFDPIMDPFLDFLEEGKSSLLVNIYPYFVYRLKNQIPNSYMFKEHPFNFRDDLVTAVLYRNLFDIMADSIVAALAISGHENIPLIVTETGWPSSLLSSHIGNNAGETEANAGETEATVPNAELYLRGLTNHLKFGLATPLKKEAISDVYIYQLFDEGNLSSQSVLQWGIMYHNNMTMKYKIDFSGSAHTVFWNRGVLLFVLFLLLLCFFLLIWLLYMNIQPNSSITEKPKV